MPEPPHVTPINSRLILSVGFGIILGLMVMLILIWYSNVNSTQDEIDDIVNVHNKKTALIAELRDLTRKRALSLYRLRLLFDPDEIELEQQKFKLMEGDLIIARLRFIELQINEAEQETWDFIKILLDIDQQSQQRSLELILDLQISEVDLSLLDYVIPTQTNLMKQFSKLLNIQRAITRNAANSARKAHDKTLNITVILGTMATIIGILIAILAINRTSHAEVVLLRESNNAQEANRLKSEFIANMSHELRTPLNAILGFSEVLIEDAIIDHNEIYLSDLRNINSAGRELLALINSILDLSKLDAGKLELHPQKFSIQAIVNETATLIQPLAEKNNIQLIILCGPEKGAIYADELRVRQSIFNLLSNACKFSKNGKVTLDVTTKTEKDKEQYVVINISDTGVGIDHEQLNNLFQPFNQLDASVNRKYGGAGLGLILTKHYC